MVNVKKEFGENPYELKNILKYWIRSKNEDLKVIHTGFTAQADLEAENLVLFSVPYDDGFTATVNGVPAEVEKVDNGLMAVAAPAGHSEIVFTYHTAGLRQSVAVSAGAIVVYAVWVAVLHRKKRREESSVG